MSDSEFSGDYGEDNISIIPIGERTTVPNDDLARLMYYLSCVDTVINYQGIDKLSDFRNYKRLTVDDASVLFKLVLLFNPEIFLNAKIFILQIDPLPNGADNQFYEITNERIGIHINNQIVIGGRTVRVMKFMVCNPAWLIRNYYRPWKNIFEKADRYLNGQLQPPSPPNVPIDIKRTLTESLKISRSKGKNKQNEKPSVEKPVKVDRSKNYCCIIF